MSDTGEADAFAFSTRQLENELALLFRVRLEDCEWCTPVGPAPVGEARATGVGWYGDRLEDGVKRLYTGGIDIAVCDLDALWASQGHLG